jgi:hypothetical protein
MTTHRPEHGVLRQATRVARPTPATGPTVLFIAGLGRSGTTVLERSIGEVDGVAAMGEVVHLWHRGIQLGERCGCGQPFADCPFWREVGTTAFGGWGNVDVRRVEALRESIDRSRRIPAVLGRRLRPDFAARLEEYTSYYRRIYDAVGSVSGARVIVDSSKHPSLAFCLSSRPDLDIRVVHVVRDPRAVAFSWTKTVNRPEATAGVDDLMHRYSPAQTAMFWNSHNLALTALSRTRTPTLTVRYEDFASAPRDTLRSIVSWAGLGDDVPLPISAHGVATLTSAHTVSGNPARFDSGQVVIARKNDEARAGLTPRQRRTVTSLTWPLLARYGYSARADDGRP